MSELLIERFCKMLSGQLREYVEDIEERRLIELLRSIVQESTELRTVFESKMVQLNQDDSVGFQTWVESGAKAFIGSNYIIQDSEVLKAGLRFLLDDLAKQPVGTPENLPYTGASKFVGRDYELETLHQMLQQSNTVAISAVAGMGGVGKTELALQYAYAQLKQNSYPDRKSVV